MSTTLSVAAPTETDGQVRWDTWLFSRRADLSLVLVPLLLAGGAAAIATWSGGAIADHPARLANWTAQNVLGNATHVVLTFLLFWAHPQVLDAVPGQKRTVLLGSAAMLGVGGLFFLTSSWNREAHALIVLVIFNVFGLHHTLAQHKGFWALHSLRGRGAGVTVGDLERRLQQSYVPVLLMLFMLRLFFVAEPDGRAFLDVGQGATVLPRATLGALLLVWVGYFALLFRSLLRSPVTSGPKLLYVSAFAFGTWLVLVEPLYGSVVLPGMHGLEYYLLTARMLKPDDGADSPRLPTRRVVPAMLLVMLPIFALGVYSAFLAPAVSNAPVAPGGGLAPNVVMRALACLSLGVVLAHYFADAFIYRLRLPGVRAAMMPRLRIG